MLRGRFAAMPWSRESVVIALTGWGRDEDRQRTASAGFDAHMVKPIHFDELTRLIRALAR